MADVSRRQFLTASATAMGVAWLGGSRLRAEDEAMQATMGRYGGFKMGIQSFTLRHFSLTQTIEHVADLGLHWVEFFPGQLEVTQDQGRVAEVAELLSPHAIRMHAHGVHGFTGDEAHNRRIFEFAKLADIPVLTADPTPEAFPILDELVKEYDIRIAIHNHGPGHRYDTVEDSLEAVEGFDERIGFCPDTGHYMRSGVDPVEAIERSADRLYAIHLKDQAGVSRDEPPETILGEGAIDLEAVCRALREAGYDQPISLEYELNPDNPFDDIRQGLANFASAAEATA